jgi:hypothetical protein
MVLHISPPDSPYGLHLQLLRQFAGEPDQESKQAELARRLAEAGVRWGRETLNWQHIEREQGVFSWERTERALGTLQANGIEPLAQLMGTAKWASSAPDDVSWKGPGRTFYPATDGITAEGGDAALWQHFVRETVSRYGYGPGGLHMVRYWEIWNEPDLDYWQGTVADYELLLRVAYQTIQEVDLSATVVLGGVSHLNLGEGDWADQLLDLMINVRPQHTAWFDVFNYHDYTGNLEENAQAVRILLDKYGLEEMPVWVTEVNLPGKSRGAQADKLPRIYERLLGAGVERIFWFLGVDVAEGGWGGNTGFEKLGLFDRAMSPQPVYEAYRLMAAPAPEPEGETAYKSQYVLFPQGVDWDWYEAAKNYLIRYRVTLGQSADDAGVVRGGLDHVITVINPDEKMLAYLGQFAAIIDPIYAETPDDLTDIMNRRVAADDRFGDKERRLYQYSPTANGKVKH